MHIKLRDIIEYIVALVSEFGARYHLTDREAYRYIDFHKGITFIENHYGIMHTLDFDEAVDSVRLFCRRSGGKI